MDSNTIPVVSRRSHLGMNRRRGQAAVAVNCCCELLDKAMGIHQRLRATAVSTIVLALMGGGLGLYRTSITGDLRIAYGVMALLMLLATIPVLWGLRHLDSLAKAIAHFTTILDQSLQGSVDSEVDNELSHPAQGELGSLGQSLQALVNTYQSAALSQSYLDNIVNAIPDFLIVLDRQGTIQRLNQAAQIRLEATDGSLLGRPFSQVLAYPEIADLILTGTTSEIELVYQSTNGTLIPVLLSSSLMCDRQSRIQYIVCLAHDISEHQHTQAQLSALLSQLQGTLEATTDGILVTDLKCCVQRYNQRFIDMLELPKGVELIDVKNSLHYISVHFADTLGFECRIAEIMYDLDSESFDQLTTRDGRVIERYSRPLWVGDRISGRVWSCRDVTQRYQTESALRHNVLHDSLTGLPNRVMLQERISDAMQHRDADPKNQFALLFLDLDRFKIINDSLGHLIGDQLLVSFGQRIRDCIRTGDILARLGGDEFAILIDPLVDINQAIEISERIQCLLEQPFMLQGQEVFISASIGITLGKEAQQTIEGILRDADTAMYCAKIAGKAQHAVFDQQMHEHVLQRMTLENDLRRALLRNELFVCYQPIVSLNNQSICGVEALIRWQHPEQGLISPAHFIPIAEDTGMIIAIGEWVLKEACKQLRQWQTYSRQTLILCVNLSARQLMQADIVERVSQILEDCNIDPHYLKLEITESILAENPELATKKLLKLRELGIQIAIDDFGTGYSSLSYLHNFPINTLKIDRSFIEGLETDSDKLELVRAILTLVKSLGINAIAEGIETSEQLSSLLELSCQYGQGYLFSHPVDSSVIHSLLTPIDSPHREYAIAAGAMAVIN